MRIYTYIIIMLGLLVLLTFLGFDTSFSVILESTGLINNPSEFSSSIFYVRAISIFYAVAAASIIIGLYSKFSPESYFVAGMSIILIGFILDIINVLNEVTIRAGGTANWIYMAAAIILIPFIGGYIISVIEWWRGSD